MSDFIKKIVICDCIGCGNRPYIKQGFFTKKGLVVIDLCKPHRHLLMEKISKGIPLDEDILKWLLVQDTNININTYGMTKTIPDKEMIRELSKIELDYD